MVLWSLRHRDPNQGIYGLDVAGPGLFEHRGSGIECIIAASSTRFSYCARNLGSAGTLKLQGVYLWFVVAVAILTTGLDVFAGLTVLASCEDRRKNREPIKCSCSISYLLKRQVPIGFKRHCRRPIPSSRPARIRRRIWFFRCDSRCNKRAPRRRK